MSKVVVVDASSSCGANKLDEPDACVKRFETWVPVEYVAEDLKLDVARYWQLNASKLELHDEHGNVLSGFSRVASPIALRRSTLTLHRVKQAPTAASASPGSLTSSSLTDPFVIRDRIFDLFVLFALQNPLRKGQLALTKHQFKQLLQRSALFPTTRKLEFETNVELALKRCVSLARDGEASAAPGVVTFDGFLDALVTVARLLFPKARPEEEAFEQLLYQYLIPFYHAEQQIGRGYPSWADISVLVAGERVDEVAQRLTKSLSDLAETYSTTPSSMSRDESLTFHEFRRFVCDVKPKELHVSSADLCKIFLHFFRFGKLMLDEGVATPSMSDRMGASGSRHDVGNSRLVLSCKGIVSPLGAIAWLAMARLAKTKNLSLFAGQSDGVGVTAAQPPSGKMQARVLKALLHHIALHLRDRSSVFTVKSAAHSLARQRFLLEFERMHREDNLEDYQHVFLQSIQQQQQPHQQKQKQKRKQPADDTNPSTSLSVVPDVVDTPCNPPDKLAFLDEASMVFAETDTVEPEWSANEPATAVRETSRDQKQDQRQREQKLHELVGMCNEADEMYAFLASELLRYSAEKRELDGARMIEPMLDVWAAAGENYSKVIAQLQEPSKTPTAHRRADTFARWGMSLEVFAIQVLKHTTTVYEYEALFGITNPRVFSVASELWRDISSLFGADLAMESLSLASAKISRAAEEHHALLGGDTYCAPDPTVSSDEDDENDGGLGPSACYEKYLACVFHRANCLTLYGDTLAHGKAVNVDYQLGCTLEEESDAIASAKDTAASQTPTPTFFASSEVLAKTSSCGAFYNEARKMYAFLLNHSRRHAASGGGGPSYSLALLYRNLGAVQFKLAALVPQGCVVESLLLEASLANAVAARRGSEQQEESRSTRGDRVASYIRAVSTVRQSFFQAETSSLEHASSPSSETRSARRSEERIVPFYRFILAAAFREFDSDSIGRLDKAQLSEFNKLIKRGGEVSESTMGWLLASFDSQSDDLSERGFLCYFCWLAEAGTRCWTSRH